MSGAISVEAMVVPPMAPIRTLLDEGTPTQAGSCPVDHHQASEVSRVRRGRPDSHCLVSIRLVSRLQYLETPRAVPRVV
eukprot:s1705_g2.t1